MFYQLKAVAAAFLLSLGAPPNSANAASDEVDPLAGHFATCLGRYSAEADYNRLMGRDVSRVAARAILFDEMLHAIADDAPVLEKSRNSAAGAHWALLHTADRSFDARMARHAALTSQRNIAMCEMLVLG